MSLRTVVAAPFRGRGRSTLSESEFVVALSLDRDWFSPDQAARVVDIATSAGLLSLEGDDLVATFDVDSVDVPADFRPSESLLVERSAFEQVLDAVTGAGVDKREAVAAINRLQADLDVTVEAAAVVFACRRGVDVGPAAAAARTELIEE